MLFNSWSFPVFLALVWVVYRALPHRQQNMLLVVASYVFYGWWDWRFLSLLAISTVVDFTCGRLLHEAESPRLRKLYLRISLATNLGILGFFKYFNFFIDSVAAGLSAVGLEANLPLLEVVLPVGISFYTFQTMAYTIDIYRHKETPTGSFLDFALYVAYFPQLVAGPIERSTHLLPQIREPRSTSPRQLQTGLELIVMGYAKKVLIADSVAPYVNQVFASPADMGRAELVLGVYLFAIQIYGDFAGYTDIARGVSRLFGIELGLNFRQPYVSANITEFWRRWHISLSSWLRDYLYIPLGGNRHGELMTYRNNMLTMLLGGLWHGASWNFVVWGGLHGGYLAAHKLSLRGERVGLTHYPTNVRAWLNLLAKGFATFHLVCLAWVFFRADTLVESMAYVVGIISGPTTALGLGTVAVMAVVLAVFGGLTALMDLGCWKHNDEVPVPRNWPWWLRGTTYGALISLLFVLGESDAQPFIYFQF